MRRYLVFCALLCAAPLMAQIPVRQSLGNGLFAGPETKPPGSFLGVALAEIDADRAKALRLNEARGVEVGHVEEGSPADKGGIKPGDVLLTYNGENLLGAEQLGRLVRETPPGRKVKIELWRNGKMETVIVQTEARKTRTLEPPSGTFVPMPNMPNFVFPDLPSAMLMWKSGMLGIECEAVDSQLAQYFGVKQGVLVRYVSAGSPAANGGLKAGDVVTKVGDHSVAVPRDITAALRMERTPGKPVPILVTRERKQMTLNITPEDPAIGTNSIKTPQ
jgi:serine protease Do